MSYQNRRSRVRRLEREDPLKGGPCPGCGWGPDDVRTILVGLTRPRPDGTWPPLAERTSGDAIPDQPGRPVCPVCGGWMPPIVFIDTVTEAEDAAAEAAVQARAEEDP